ncbi:MAG: lmo0937 family membrane protein [Anaerolineae bacterium]|nr:lmo0937 family membrane protein [Anaerolineae bacterium]MCI0610690.1 lmo0937 family membrane protein [Anaerolineae bacterium]
MLETIIIILLILWLVGAFGRRGRWRGGNLIHALLVIAAILLIVRLLQ